MGYSLVDFCHDVRAILRESDDRHTDMAGEERRVFDPATADVRQMRST